MSGNIACRQGPNFWDGQTLYDTHVCAYHKNTILLLAFL